MSRDKILDRTDYSGEFDEEPQIRLRQGIDVKSLLDRHGGVVFEPELDENVSEAATQQDYFSKVTNDQELLALIERMELEKAEVEEEQEEEEEEGEEGFKRIEKRMTNVLEDGGVKKKVTSPGLLSEGTPPNSGTVTIHYTLFLEHQDEPYDSTKLRGQCERFKLDDHRLLPGIEIAIKSMCKKEKASFMIQPEYAFGQMGCPPRIPENAQILAKIELLDFVQEAEAEALLAIDPTERSKARTFSEIMAIARKENLEGNSAVKEGEWKMAAKRYQQGIRLLDDAELANDSEEEEQKRLLLKLLLNRAHCLIKIHWPKKACLDLQRALELDDSNSKALYRLGKAKRMLGNLEDARRFLIRAQRAAPDDTTVGNELASLDRQITGERKNEKALCRKMFGGDGYGGNRNDESGQRRNETAVSDDFLEEVHEQLQGFLLSSSVTEFPFPTSFSAAERRAIKNMVRGQMEGKMEVEERKRGSWNQLVVVKK